MSTSSSFEQESAAETKTMRETKPVEAVAENEDPQSEPLATQPEPMVPLTEYDRMKAERDQLFDRLARLQAEFDNARKREARERADFRDFAVSGAVEQFLPVLDNFQLALNAQGTAEQLRTGVELIVKQMEEALRAVGVQAIETVGTQFDPRIHEALGSIETNEAPDQQVMEEVRRGYRVKEKLLRPALVKVASNTSQREA